MNKEKPATKSAVQSASATVDQPFSTKEKLCQIMFFTMMAVAMLVTNGYVSMILVVLAAIFTIGKKPIQAMRENFNLAVIGLFAFALMNGLAAVFAEFGPLAVGEFYKFMASFSVAVIFLVLFRKHHLHGILWGLAGLSALIGLLGVDAAVGGPIFSGFQAVVSHFGVDYSSIYRVMDGRINGIYNDPNVTGGLLAVGTLISLYLVDRTQETKQRLLASLLLGISALSFFLSMSRGAIACFAVSLLVWICTCGKEHRIRTVLLMVISAVVTVIISVGSIAGIRAQSFLGTLSIFVCGLIIFGLDHWIGQRLSVVLEQHKKAAVISVLALIALAAVYLVASVNITGSHTVLPDEIFRRAVALQPGNYTVSGDWDGNPNMLVRVRTEEEIVLDHWTDVYNGPLGETAFTVPENTAQIQVHIYTTEPTEIRAVEFSDGTQVKLGYPLLPAFVADRIQDGLLTSTNVAQRGQFLKDGLKIFASSPMMGHGLGSTEELYTSVQPFFYMTLFVHNHLVQVMCDMGLIGLAAFLLFLLGSLLPLLCHLRGQRDPLAGMLLACWVMINMHSWMEINFSVRGYQIFVFPVLLLPALLYAKPWKEKVRKVGSIASVSFVWLFVLVFGGLVGSHIMVATQFATFSPTSVEEFMSTNERFAARDVFDRDTYQLNYIANAVAQGDERYMPTARKYVSRLRAQDNYTNCFSLAEYYYLPLGDFPELFRCSRQGIAQEASNPDAWNVQFQFYRDAVLPAVTVETVEAFVTGVLDTKAYLEEYRADHWEDIPITPENLEFINLLESIQAQNITEPQALMAALSLL